MAYSERIPSYEDLRAFALVYLRAVALSWTDEEFKARLTHDPEGALTEYFNYKCPFAITLKVRELSAEEVRSGCGWQPAQAPTDAGNWKLPPNEVVFSLPTRPDPMYDEAIALAAFADSGPGYLFSCC